MPGLLEHIDAIARKLQRDVLYLAFIRADPPFSGDYEELDSRKCILQWFDDESIPWRECGPVANENVMRSYAGEVYIDVPYDEADPTYQKVQAFLEFPDGTIRFEDVRFWIVSLEHAMKNARHDEPGFWEQWAENF